MRIAVDAMGGDHAPREIIRGVLQHARGNVTRAAALLQLSRDTLRYRIAKHKIQTSTGREANPD